MLIRRFMIMILLGVGMELGARLTQEGVEIAKDPHKRCVIKQKADKIKNILFKKNKKEES